MEYRQFFHQGKPTDRVDATEGGFGVTDDVGVSEVAALLNVPADEVTAERVKVPQEPAVVLPATALEVVRPPIERLMDAIEAATTLADLKTAVRQIRR